MTNQMKKILIVCLILSYVSFAGLTIVLVASGFTFRYVISYVFLAISAVLCAYFQYLQLLIMKQDEEFADQIFYAKKLLQLREMAKLRFYKSRGLEPKYNEDGTIMEPDKFIGILTKLDEEGHLEKSIYEILGIEPVFDKSGKEVPAIIVLKHLMKKPRTSNIEGIKGITKKMVAKGTGEATKNTDKNKDEKKVVQSTPNKEEKKKADQPVVYAKYFKKEEKSKKPKAKQDGKSGGEKQPKDTNLEKKEESPKLSPQAEIDKPVEEYIINTQFLKEEMVREKEDDDTAVLE